MMDMVTCEDFDKLDIRTGTILSAELVPKSKKLVKLRVSFGPDIGERTIVAGIASMAADCLDETGRSFEGLLIVAVVNIAPRLMFGIESHGMLLASAFNDADGHHLRLIQAVGCPDGAKVG